MTDARAATLADVEQELAARLRALPLDQARAAVDQAIDWLTEFVLSGTAASPATAVERAAGQVLAGLSAKHALRGIELLRAGLAAEIDRRQAVEDAEFDRRAQACILCTWRCDLLRHRIEEWHGVSFERTDGYRGYGAPDRRALGFIEAAIAAFDAGDLDEAEWCCLLAEQAQIEGIKLLRERCRAAA
jgi:hypothetical protein